MGEIIPLFVHNHLMELAVESAKEALAPWNSGSSRKMLEVVYVETLFSCLKIIRSTQNREIRERAAEYLFELGSLYCYQRAPNYSLNLTEGQKLSDLDFLLELSLENSNVGTIANHIHEAYIADYKPFESSRSPKKTFKPQPFRFFSGMPGTASTLQ